MKARKHEEPAVSDGRSIRGCVTVTVFVIFVIFVIFVVGRRSYEHDRDF
jgi:hypothetical protein